MADLSDKYNTNLTDAEEQQFQAWAKKSGKGNDTYDYDLRGAWKDLQVGEGKEYANGHMTDKYKKPNHPTFSNESQYHGTDGHEGGEWVKEKDGSYTFNPSETNLKNMPAPDLKKYFDEREPGNRVTLPEEQFKAGYGDTKE